MQFSLDHKLRSHKQNQSSASNSVGLIFTRLHRSKLLSTTPITTLSLVKTSLDNKTVAFLDAPPPAKVKFCFMTLIKVHWHNSIQNPKQLLFLMSPQIRAVFNRVP